MLFCLAEAEMIAPSFVEKLVRDAGPFGAIMVLGVLGIWFIYSKVVAPHMKELTEQTKASAAIVSDAKTSAQASAESSREANQAAQESRRAAELIGELYGQKVQELRAQMRTAG